MAKTSENTFQATGRRKTSVASVVITPGEGNFLVNGRDINEYFKIDSQRIHAIEPLVLTDNQKKFDIKINAKGGGLMSQAGATRMAISRALTKLDAELRAKLKPAGMLTRDPRMKERKKSGQPGARKRFQFSKR